MQADELLEAYGRVLTAFEPYAKIIAIVLWISFIIYATLGIVGTL